MTVLTPTKDVGGVAKIAPGLYGEPDRLIDDATLNAELDLPGLNAAFVADMLSAFLTHERCGHHLYRSVAARTNNPLLKQRYEHYGNETLEHVEILEELVLLTGGNPAYVSPLARTVEGKDSKLLESTFLLDGTIDVMTTEMAMLDAVFVAESVDQANWTVLQKLTDSLPAGEIREAFESAANRVLSQEDDHLEWSREMRTKMTMLQLESSTMAKAGMKAEEMLANVRGWFS
jgi:rubrerythrin